MDQRASDDAVAPIEAETMAPATAEAAPIASPGAAAHRLLRDGG